MKLATIKYLHYSICSKTGMRRLHVELLELPAGEELLEVVELAWGCRRTEKVSAWGRFLVSLCFGVIGSVGKVDGLKETCKTLAARALAGGLDLIAECTCLQH